VIKAIRSDIVAEVLDFAAFDRGEPQARATLKASSNIGIESFIQGQTGYLPEKYSESTLEPRHRIQRLVKDANPWEQLYSAAVCDKVRRWYFPRDFFWRFAYSWMTQEERDFLNQFNPIEDSTSQRKNRIHQMLSEETRDRLEPEIDKICLLIETSTSRSDFEVRYGRVDGLNQLEIAYV
jgi:replicative superfamily II helicase